ncbi:MAG: exo-alpha-sialidase [Clostridia bacterium]|nr:exo-alpha-sialidase [Clostridia bacterium]
MKVKHITVAFDEPSFFGWPANHGIWIFDDELLVGFEKGIHHYNGPDVHALDRTIPTIRMFARFRPETGWVHEFPEIPAIDYENKTRLPDVPADLLTPESGLYLMPSGWDGNVFTQLMVTNDKGKSWQGPFYIPDFGLVGVAARTDYIVCDGYFLLAMTGVKADGLEGNTFAAKLTFDGKWEKLGMMGEDPPEGDFRIMPAIARLPDGSLLGIGRYASENEPGFTQLDVYLSNNEGKTWDYETKLTYVGNDMSGGSPPALCTLPDGTVLLAFFRRQSPHGLFITTTRDGKNWSEPQALRTDAVNTDIGYPRIAFFNNEVHILYYYNLGEEAPRFVADTVISDWETLIND